MLAGGLGPVRSRRPCGGRGGHRARAQHPSAVGVARPGRGAARRGGGRDAPAQLSPLLRDRDPVPRRRRLHALPRPEHAPGRAAPRAAGNLPEAAIYGAGLWCQQPRIVDAAGRFVAPSRFARPPGGARLRREQISVAHNFLPAGAFAAAPPAGAPEYALYAGRLVGGEGRGHGGRGSGARGRATRDRGKRPEAESLAALAARRRAGGFLGQLAPTEMRKRSRGRRSSWPRRGGTSPARTR